MAKGIIKILSLGIDVSFGNKMGGMEKYGKRRISMRKWEDVGAVCD